MRTSYIKAISWLLWGLLGIGFQPYAFANKLSFIAHELRPLTYQENSAYQGLAWDLVQALMKQRGVAQPVTVHPFQRALFMVQQEPDIAMFHLMRTPAREATVHWVGPLVSNTVYFYKKKGLPLELKTLEDFKKVASIGVGRGNADDTLLTSLGFSNLLRVDNQEQAVQMLEKGRVQVAPVGELVMREVIKAAGLSPDLIENTGVSLSESVLYLAFSKNVSLNEVNSWQKSWDEFKNSSEYQSIYQKYVPSK